MKSPRNEESWKPVLDEETGIVWVDGEATGDGIRLLVDRHVVMWTSATSSRGHRVFHFGEQREIRGDTLLLFEPGDLFDGREIGRLGRFRLVFVPELCTSAWFDTWPWRTRQGRVAELQDAAAVAAMHRLAAPGEPGWSNLVRRALDAVVDAVQRAPASSRGPVSVAVRRAHALVLRRWTDPPSLDELAGEVGVSKYHLLRRFRLAYGATPAAYGRLLRAAAARSTLAAGGSVADAVGDGRFADQAHLTRVFRDVYLQTPRRYADSPTK